MEVLCLKEEDTMAPTQIDQSASALLSLPAELRNAIWSLLLVQQEPIAPSWVLRDATSQHTRVCADVLRVCKQINFEGTPILYGENQFTAHPSLLATLPSLVLFSSPRRVTCPPVTCQRVAKLIRRYHLHVRLDTDPRFTRAQVEASFAGVDELQIEVFQAMYGSCDFSVLSHFEGVRGVGRAVVYGSVGDGRYARWLAAAMMSNPGAQLEPFAETYVGGDPAISAWIQSRRMYV